MNQKQKTIAQRNEPLICLFSDIKATDRAIRGLIAIGLHEDQTSIVDLEQLILEFNTEIVDRVTTKPSAARLSDLNADFTEDLGLTIADAIDLPRYLIDAGVPETAAQFYACKIRDRMIMLIAEPGDEHYSDAKRFLDEMG